jgi:hypothetical protein
LEWIASQGDNNIATVHKCPYQKENNTHWQPTPIRFVLFLLLSKGLQNKISCTHLYNTIKMTHI